jgi:hypothetical protein
MRSSPSISPAPRCALLEPLIERASTVRAARPRLRLAHDRKLVAAAQDLHAQLVLDLGEVAVELAAEVDQQAVVGNSRSVSSVSGRPIWAAGSVR